jgi:hypothetical protein
MTGGPWRRRLTRGVLIYLAIGVAISTAQNLWARTAGEPTVFVWAGSLRNQVVLLIWWYLVPVLTWPVDLFWTLYHSLRR